MLLARKLHQRMDLMCHATSVAGGVYLYANQCGCDGGRLYYDGSACIIVNGQLLAQVGTCFRVSSGLWEVSAQSGSHAATSSQC